MYRQDNVMKLDEVARNFHTVTIGTLKLYFSYSTIVAYSVGGKLTICENVYSKTTGKHLNSLCSDKKTRQGEEVFLKSLQNTLELYGLDKRMASGKITSI